MTAVWWRRQLCLSVLKFAGSILLILAVGVAVMRLPPPEPRLPWACPRFAAGGWELVSFKVAQDGHEYDCRFVKRGVR